MIALSMIVGGYEKPENLERVLKSVEGQVDKAFIVITSESDGKLQKKAEELGAVVHYKPGEFDKKVSKSQVKFIKTLKIKPKSKVGEKIFLFDKARNYAFDMVPPEYRWILWLDVDDVLRGEKLKEAVAEAEKFQAQAIFVNYIYQAEIVDGKIKNILIEHLRERIIQNTGLYRWIAPIHETLIEQIPTRKIETKLVDVLHLSGNERMVKAIDRNITNLEYAVYKSKGKDPRQLYYLGKAYYDVWLGKKDSEVVKYAERLFKAYLFGDNKSGWAEERSQCWEYLVDIYRNQKKYDEAIKCAHNAMIEDDRFPSIYVNLGLCYVHKGEWQRALFWAKRALSIDQPNSTLVSTPRDLMGRAMEVVYHSALNLSKLDEAWAAAIKLVELHPNNEEFKNRVRLIDSLKKQSELTKLVVGLAKYHKASGEIQKLKPLVETVPAVISDNPFMVELANEVDPPRTWRDNEIAMFIGPCFTQWSPKNLGQEGGFVGGSEEATIYLARELALKGWKVTVFADPGAEEGMHDGVLYLPYYKWNKRDKFNIMIAWRRPDFVDQAYTANRTYVWCHDIQNQLDYTEERLAKIEKVMVLSQWHRNNIPNVPDEKIFITANGINL